jgi:MFS family permease
LLITSAVLPDDAFMSWGWRIPFLFSGVILAYGLWLRTNLEETPTFRRIEQSNTKARNPFKEVIRQQPRSLVTIAVMVFSQSGIAYFYQVFMLTYATNQLGMGRTETFTGLIIAQVSCTILIPIFGMASDSVGRRPVILFGFVFSALLAFPGFWLLGSTDVPGLLWLIMFLGNGIGVAAIYGPMGTYITELFNARHAYTGLGLGRETGNSLGAALVPVLAVQLAFNDSGSTWALSLLLVVIAVFGAFAVQASTPRDATAGVDEKREATHVDVARRDV